jgi:membrane-associated phospholipid phosphatase
MDTVIKLLADYLLIPLVLVAAYALLWKAPARGKYDRYARVIMAGLTSYWLAKVIGYLWQPEALRPFEKLGVEAGASYLGNPGFPSDHVLFAMFLALAVWYVARKPLWTGIMLVMVAGIGVGRILALVHSPLDVAGGVLIALLGAGWYVAYGNKSLQTILAKKSNK